MDKHNKTNSKLGNKHFVFARNVPSQKRICELAYSKGIVCKVIQQNQSIPHLLVICSSVEWIPFNTEITKLGLIQKLVVSPRGLKRRILRKSAKNSKYQQLMLRSSVKKRRRRKNKTKHIFLHVRQSKIHRRTDAEKPVPIS